MSLCAPAITDGACSRPGWRDSRSIGPVIDTAATTRPDGPRTGADTDATPGLALADALRPAATADAGQRGRAELGALQPAVQPVRLLPGEQDLRGRAGVHRQRAADRDGVAQADRPLGRGHADPLVALAAVQLGALAGVVAQRGQHRPGGGQQPVLAGGRGRARPAAGPSTNRPCMSRATRRWCSSATASRCAVGRARPVAATSWASVAGRPRGRSRTMAALSSTPTPLELSMPRYCRLKS